MTKVLGGVLHQESEGVDRAPSPTISKGSVGLGGCEASRLDHTAVPKVSPQTTAGNQALSSLWPLMMARKPAVNLNPPKRRRMPPVKMRMQRFMRMMLRS